MPLAFLFWFLFFSIIRLSLISLLHTKALLQQGGTLGQKEAETEDQAGKKIDSDSENDQDSAKFAGSYSTLSWFPRQGPLIRPWLLKEGLLSIN